MSEDQGMATSTDNPSEHERPASPASDIVSMKSERSRDEPDNFSDRKLGPLEHKRIDSPASNKDQKNIPEDDPLNFLPWSSPFEHERPPASDIVSMKSERSRDEPHNFSDRKRGPLEHKGSDSSATNKDHKNIPEDDPMLNVLPWSSPLEHESPVSPESDIVSMKSERSRDEPHNFSDRKRGPLEHKGSDSSATNKDHKNIPEDDLLNVLPWSSPLEHESPVSPESDIVSMKSERSRDEPHNFSDRKLGPLEHKRLDSPATNKDHKNIPEDDLLNCLPDSSPLEHKRSDSPASSDYHKNIPEDDPFNFYGSSQSQSQRPASPVQSSASMERGQSQDCRNSSQGSEKEVIQRLKAELKKTILRQHEDTLKGQETETEIYKIKDNKATTQTYDALFHSSTSTLMNFIPGSQKNKLRTVLMTGDAGVGKTFHKRRFMVDWANGKSNKDIDLIVSFDFSELNSRRDEVQSMKDLLRHSLDDNKPGRPCHYDKCKVAFVLDGLDKCKLPLDFENNKKLTDMEEKASMDVLLTNLINGNLLPKAHLWIISQPSGVTKIPSKFIQKETECRDKDLKHLLTKELKKTILNQHEDKLKGHGDDTEIYELQETDKNKKPKAQTYDALFSGSQKKKVRTVLMTGDACVGKTFQTRRFMVDWAKGKSNTNIDLIVSFDFSELNSRRDKVQSMKDLLRHSLDDNKTRRPCHYDKCKVAFVLDGLEKCELPLDFEKNKNLTDMEEKASMDVLLTNLIKGNLLPKAHLWIISQPSGVDKIPSGLIQKFTECQDKDFTHLLTAELKKIICSQHEEKLKGHEDDTEIYELQKADKNKKPKAQTYEALFSGSQEKKVRTVLMRGVARIGKTFQTGKFMVDWAKGESNKNIDLIVSFDFSEQNSRRDKVQSMKDLLRHSLDDNKTRRPCHYDKCGVAFVLDGLEKCKLPLDFEKNKNLTDMEDKASMDVLLTNLIKGNLLPKAHLWIISQPSGVDKIPSEFIQKETECRETSKRRQRLIKDLKKRFLRENTQEEDINHPNQKETEHIMREDTSDEVNDEKKKGCPVKKLVTSVSDIFKDEKEQRIRTVLTIGEGNVGKSFHMQKFIKEWAENNEVSFLTSLWNKVKGQVDDEVIFPLNFSELNLKKKGEVSLVGLLNDFFKETKEFVISDFEQFKVLFVLDGLEAYQPSLGFDNNVILTDVRELASLDVLLTNLIRGELLPSARIWITSRPSAAKQLPDTCVDRMTEIRCKPDIASQQKLKAQLKKQFTCVSEGIDMQKTSALLDEIYTDLYIIEGERGEVNNQNESRQAQDAKFKPVTQDTLIKYHDILKQSENKPIGTVLTTGLSGIGKSFATMKYMLDWANGKANKDLFYIFPLSFRELNLRKEKEHSLEQLINDFFPCMETSEIRDYDKYNILIVLDGFDECRLDLKLNEGERWTDVTKPTSVEVLLANLIQGKLLPKAQIWITSRPAASNSIPADKVDRVTEVRGFNDEQKDVYFKKRFRGDKDLAEKILSNVKKSRSLYIMCHIPVFCWITSIVLEDFEQSRDQEGNMPNTLTDMYIYFLLLQCRQANVKYGDETGESSETQSCWNTRNKKTIITLGKLAFEGLNEGNFLFTEEHLTECGLDITETAVFSGLLTQVKREEHGVYQQKLFCFVHLSIQEFLAANYVFLMFNNNGENMLAEPSTSADLHVSDFYKTAVDKALGSKNGDWDLFLRFLLGLSLEANQHLLPELLKNTENNEETNKATIEYIKDKIRDKNSDPDKNLNLFHCLNELHDHSLVKEVQKYLDSETDTFENWSALTFVLLTSDQNLDVFDLKKYLKSEEALQRLLPVVKVAISALLSWCELSEVSCIGLSSSVLSSASNNLTLLDLSHNDLLDSGVQKLADGVGNLNCKLEILKLSGCQVTDEGCSSLASALKSNKASSLKQLDLSYNHPGEHGKMVLSAIAEDPNMSLKKLRFDHDGEHRLKPGLKKYGADLKLDEDTAGRRLVLSEGSRTAKTVWKVEEKVSRPEHVDRFKRTQVLCNEGQKDLCYWEVEWKGEVGIAVVYKEVGRNWDGKSGLGCNEMSWSLLCSKTGYTARHGKTSKRIEVPLCQKIAVFLDWERGTLTYYSVTSGELSVIHTFHAKFTEPLFPSFWFKKGSVTLCEID